MSSLWPSSPSCDTVVTSELPAALSLAVGALWTEVVSPPSHAVLPPPVAFHSLERWLLLKSNLDEAILQMMHMRLWVILWC